MSFSGLQKQDISGSKDGRRNCLYKPSAYTLHMKQQAEAAAKAEHIVAREVPQHRRQEILEYLKLFGYKPENTILKVHVAGFFGKKKGGSGSAREAEKRKEAAKRYGGTTFVVVGRTHDPSIIEQAARPRTKDGSPGYVGYLWMNKDPHKRPPHEIVPLDFTPVHFKYPQDWKDAFATKGMLLAMHVPASFAKDKGGLTRALYRIGKGEAADVKQEWRFLEELKRYGYYYHGQQEEATKGETKTAAAAVDAAAE